MCVVCKIHTRVGVRISGVPPGRRFIDRDHLPASELTGYDRWSLPDLVRRCAPTLPIESSRGLTSAQPPSNIGEVPGGTVGQ